MTNGGQNTIINNGVFMEKYAATDIGVREMLLDLRKVFENDDEILAFRDTLDLSDIEISGSYPFVSPVFATGQVKSLAGAAQMTVKVEFVFSIPCDRCAEQIERKYSYSFEHMLVRELNDEENDTYLQVENDTLDVSELLRSDILLELPSKFLCKPECKGLCDVCGQNLNTGTCHCHDHDVDPRLEVLKKFMS